MYLSSQADQLRVQLWRGDGVQLADVAPASVINAARSYDEANLALLNSVGALLKGQQSGAVDSLASHGVSLICCKRPVHRDRGRYRQRPGRYPGPGASS